MEGLKLAIESLEIFIKRSLMPSSSFLMIFILFDIYGNDKVLINFLEKEHHTVMIVTIFIIFTGLSTLLTILHQFIYDNRIKENYNGIFLFKDEDKELKNLRNSVTEQLKNEDSKLKVEELTDYLLYQILGKKAHDKGGDLRTTRYVDDVKTIGIFFVSLLIIAIISVTKYIVISKAIISLPNLLILVITTILLYIFYQLGKELILSKYRSRAIRIYTNFLN
jgi:hypothetical protein